jgi:hypothetical protein
MVFEVSPDPVAMKLFRADPKLLEQRFVARAVIHVPSQIIRDSRGQRNLRNYVPDELQQLANWGNAGFAFHSSPYPISTIPMPGFFNRLAASIDPLPGHTAGIEFLVSGLPDEGYVRVSLPESIEWPEQSWFHLEFLAPTEQAAKERAAAALGLLHAAIVVPLRQHLQDEAARRQRALAERQQQAAELRAEFARLNEELKASTDIDEPQLQQLKTERRLLDVDLAGQRARIRAVEQVLERVKAQVGNLSEAARRIEQLEDTKITAEIEVAGLAARQSALDELVKEGNQRSQLKSTIDQKRAELAGINERLPSAEQALEALMSVVKAYATLHELRDGKVMIHPIEWTQ